MGNSEETGMIWPPVCLGGTACPPYEEVVKRIFNNAISKPFDQSDSVAVGTVIQKENQANHSITYSINVEFYLKNPQSFDLITATLKDVVEPQTFPDVLYYNSPVFNENDLVFVYLKKTDGIYTVLPQSFTIDKHEVRGPPPTILLTKSPNKQNFEQGDEIVISGQVRKAELYNAAKNGESLDVKLTLRDEKNEIIFLDLMGIDIEGNYHYNLQTSKLSPGKYEFEINYGPAGTGDRITIEPNLKFWTPLKQFQMGISINEIQCKENLILVHKYDGSPACVENETKKTLVERGWATPAIRASLE